MKNCAILTMDCLEEFEVYDYLLDKPLAKLGWNTHLVSWRKKNVNWSEYDGVIIRSPWDYQDDPASFIDVLATIDASTAKLENSFQTVKWNIDKIYLESLYLRNVTIVPTLWAKCFSQAKLNSYFEHFDCQQLIIKPRISANADNTFWLEKTVPSELISKLCEVFSDKEFMVQPFMNSVIDEGEFSLFYFSGSYSHTILKTPKNNDFRVQEEHGGRLKAVIPETKLLNQAQHTLSAISLEAGETPLYARLDFVRFNDQFALMEAELIEPSLYFNMDEASASRFANAFVGRMT